MPKPFEVGDRVRCYAFWFGGPHKGYVGRPGTIVTLEGDGMRLDVDGYGEISAHTKQCRRLKKKEPRFERWMNVYAGIPYGTDPAHRTKEIAEKCAIPGRLRLIRLVELRPGEKIVKA